MNIAVRWIASQSASCFYAIDAVRRGRSLVHAKLAELIAEPAKRLHAAIESTGVEEDLCWRHLVPLAAQVGNNRQLAEVVLKKTVGTTPWLELPVERLAQSIGEVETTVQRELPELTKELATRAHSLGQAWTSRSEAILDGVVRRTDPKLIVPSAEVIAVPATVHGGGTAHLDYNSVSIEIGEEEPPAKLPEVLRLGWLLSQLNIDLPVFSENIHRDRRPLIASLAMLPAVLCAGEEIELARYDPQAVRTAVQAWRIETPRGVEPAEIVTQWWATYIESRPPWSVAVTALDRMLPGG